MSQDRLGTSARPCVIPGSHRSGLCRYSHGEVLGSPAPGAVPIPDTAPAIRFRKTVGEVGLARAPAFSPEGSVRRRRGG